MSRISAGGSGSSGRGQGIQASGWTPASSLQAKLVSTLTLDCAIFSQGEAEFAYCFVCSEVQINFIYTN